MELITRADSEEQQQDPAALWEEIRTLRRENGRWRLRYKLERLARESLEAELANRAHPIGNS